MSAWQGASNHRRIITASARGAGSASYETTNGSLQGFSGSLTGTAANTRTATIPPWRHCGRRPKAWNRNCRLKKQLSVISYQRSEKRERVNKAMTIPIKFDPRMAKLNRAIDELETVARTERNKDWSPYYRERNYHIRFPIDTTKASTPQAQCRLDAVEKLAMPFVKRALKKRMQILQRARNRTSMGALRYDRGAGRTSYIGI